jgi:hypothetical protein
MFFCWLEHQPSPRGWANSSPVVAGWNISPAHTVGLSPALWLGQYRPNPVHFILFLFSLLFCLVFFLWFYETKIGLYFYIRKIQIRY